MVDSGVDDRYLKHKRWGMGRGLFLHVYLMENGELKKGIEEEELFGGLFADCLPFRL